MSDPGKSYKFEDFELDSGERILRKAGELRRVEPQVFDLLHLLVSHHGKLVRKAFSERL